MYRSNLLNEIVYFIKSNTVYEMETIFFPFYDIFEYIFKKWVLKSDIVYLFSSNDYPHSEIKYLVIVDIIL